MICISIVHDRRPAPPKDRFWKGPPVTRFAPILCILLLGAPTAGFLPAQAGKARVESLDLGPHWYGAPVEDKRELVGNVVLFVLWGT
jgi:hypothetical protein